LSGKQSSPDFKAATLRKISVRLVPFLSLLYFAAFIDRVNVGFAASQMTRDLGFSAYVFGLGAGIFFIGYCLFEVPSNLVLHRVGGRLWIGRIMLTWALVAAAMPFVSTPSAFYVLRFLLGAAEAGLFPGVVYYLTYWVPRADRAKLMGRFMAAIPISTALAGPLSSMILKLDGVHGLAGWQWLFLLETIPSLLLGCITLMYLPDTPSDAGWLAPHEQQWLVQTLQQEAAAETPERSVGLWQALSDPRVLLLSSCYFGAELGLYGVILWIPQIFANVGFAPELVGFVTAIPYAVAAFAMVWWSRRSDRRNERTRHIAMASLVGFAGLTASAFLGDFPLLSLIAITLGAAGTLAILPIFWSFSAGMLRGAAAAGAIALINALGNTGGFAGPFVIGWIKTATGSFTWGLVALGVGVLSTGVIALLIGDGTTGAVHNRRSSQAPPRQERHA
jgi:ACS family tartrate transporter-like MFS transporter